MNKRFFKAFCSASLVILVTLIFQVEVRAQEPTQDESAKNMEESFWRTRAHALEGTWQVQTTTRNCQNGTVLENFSKLISFSRGGTVGETSSSSPLRTAGFGIWERVHRNSFRYTLRFFRFNPDGTSAGSVRANWNVVVNDESYTGEAVVQIVLPNGTVVATICGTETASKLVFPD